MIHQALHFHQEGKLAKAIELYRSVLSSKPFDFNALHLLGLALAQTGNLKDALELINASLKQQPTHSFALNIKGFILKELGDLDEALDSLNASIQYKDDFAEAYLNKGVVLQLLRRFEGAKDTYERGLLLEPSNTALLQNLSVVYMELKQLELSLQTCFKAITFDPSIADAYYNLGVVQFEMRHFAQALDTFQRALCISSSLTKAYLNSGLACFEKSDFQGAKEFLRKALESNPNDLDTKWNQSIAHLIQGDYGVGLELYESRLANPKFKLQHPEFDSTLWDGISDLRGKTILIYTEQGLGDAVQYSRYVQRIASLGARVILEVQPELVELFGSLQGVSQLVQRGQIRPAHDYYLPLISAAHRFYKRGEDIFPPGIYLKPDPTKVAAWSVRLKGDFVSTSQLTLACARQRKLRVGIAWSSFSDFKGDYKRSLTLQEFTQVLPRDNVDWICLQQKIKPGDEASLKFRPDLRFYGDSLKDLDDTAGLIANLDLVISTCTSIPHLSASMGVPTWLLLSYVPDWRWSMGSQSTPWYPSMRLFRQQYLNDWSSVLGAVEKALFKLIENH